jgi:diacylglycerol kinase family enzyme
MPRPALLLVNPRARRAADEADEAVTALRDAGLAVLVEYTEDPSTFRELIRRRAPEIDRVIVAGGDGTLNAAVQVLAELGLPLGIVPLGTANTSAPPPASGSVSRSPKHSPPPPSGDGARWPMGWRP